MNEKVIKNRLDNIKGLRLFYGMTPFTLDTYRIDTQYERVYMRNLDTGTEIDRPYNGIEDFVRELKPAPEKTKDIPMPKDIYLPAKPAVMKPYNTNKDTNMESFTPATRTEDAPKTLTDLRNLLLQNILLLQSGKIKIEQAKEVANQAQTIINITKVELDYYKAKVK